MTQFQLVQLLFKIGLTAGWVGILRWIIVYSRLWPWWRDRIGVSLVIKSALVGGLYFVFTMAEFIHLSHFENEIFSWVAVVLIGAVGPVMEWRTQVWKQEARGGTDVRSRLGRRDNGGSDPGRSPIGLS